MFFVDLKCKNNIDGIYNITSLLNSIVEIGKSHEHRRGPLQCYTCQDHSNTQWNHPSRCVKCGRNHFCENCLKDRSSPAKCVFCSEEHTADFKGCRVYQTTLNHNKSNPTRFHDNTTPLTVSFSTFLFLQPPPPLKKYFQTQINCSSANLSYVQMNSSDQKYPSYPSNIDILSTSFISDFINIIRPLISLLIKLIN